MRIMVIVALATMVAACGQTAGSLDRGPKVAAGSAPAASQDAGRGRPMARAEAQKVANERARCAEAIRKAGTARTNAALVGGALAMVGGLGGYAGEGGMVAAHAANIGSSAVQAHAQAEADASMAEGC